jgi:hypothetical protein
VDGAVAAPPSVVADSALARGEGVRGNQLATQEVILVPGLVCSASRAAPVDVGRHLAEEESKQILPSGRGASSSACRCPFLSRRNSLGSA